MSDPHGSTTVNPEPTSVYRYFDDLGILIYVGITKRGTQRQSEHTSKVWWPYVARQEVTHHPDRDEAESVERTLIQTLHPPYNTTHNSNAAQHRHNYEAVRRGGGAPGKPFEMAEQLNRRLPMAQVVADEDDLGPFVIYISHMLHVGLTTRMVLPCSLPHLTNQNGTRVGKRIVVSQRGPLAEALVRPLHSSAPALPTEVSMRFKVSKVGSNRIQVVPKAIACVTELQSAVA